jgi:amino-acid N-acetyltransferase
MRQGEQLIEVEGTQRGIAGAVGGWILHCQCGQDALYCRRLVSQKFSAEDEVVSIQRASKADLSAVEDLLRRSGLDPNRLGEHTDTVVVARSGGKVVGSAGLEIYDKAALLRSVAVDERLRGQGLGQRLTEAALDMARQAGVDSVYLLTRTAADFFPRFGFSAIDRAELPPSVQASGQFQTDCAKTATFMMLSLFPEEKGAA